LVIFYGESQTNMNKKIFLLFSIILIFQTFQTKAQNFFWVEFSNKSNTKYSIANPYEYLSERAIERRIRQNIPIDSLDLPVNLNYIDSVLNIGGELVHESKWLNGITVKVEMDNFLTEVEKLPFVSEVQLTKPSGANKSAINKFNESVGAEKAPIDTSKYGASVYQTGLMNGQFLHNKNFNGQGMQIAILDAGFLNADEYLAFDSLWANNQILGTKDFVDPNSNVFDANYHGMSVLSCIGGNVPGDLIGTARKASFWLLRSEDAGSEFLIEEDNWVVAAEFADSVGVDIINSSLGYFVYDDPSTDHTYADMDGKTTRVTQGANVAASRGILVFSSAGNEGNNSWKYLIAPSDGDNVIGVGATNKFGFPASFTSLGPAADGDIKPNVAAMGWNTYLQRSDGSLGSSSGTSFSSPVLAGMAACLWQAFPYTTAKQVKLALELSSSKYNNPDSLIGYGIPDFQTAWVYLTNNSISQHEFGKNWQVYPNPVANYLVLQQDNIGIEKKVRIEIYSVDGRKLKQWIKSNTSKIILNGLQSLPSGILLLKVISDNSSETLKIYKHR